MPKLGYRKVQFSVPSGALVEVTIECGDGEDAMELALEALDGAKWTYLGDQPTGEPVKRTNCPWREW